VIAMCKPTALVMEPHTDAVTMFHIQIPESMTFPRLRYTRITNRNC